MWSDERLMWMYEEQAKCHLLLRALWWEWLRWKRMKVGQEEAESDGLKTTR